jgi:hypothetical protein
MITKKQFSERQTGLVTKVLKQKGWLDGVDLAKLLSFFS